MTDQTTAELAAEAERFKRDYLNACKTIADMHAAATGYDDRGPERGVVEDVADVRARMLAAEAALERVRAAIDVPSLPRSEADRIITSVRAALAEPTPAVTEGTEPEKTARVFAALHRSAEQDVSRVIDLYERWVKAGPPPLGTSLARWWDARLIELHDAILPPTNQPKEQ